MSSIKPIAYLFPQTSRAQTPDAPPYDDTRRAKSWVDPHPGPGPTVTYQVLDPNGNVVSLTLSVAEAATLNLPGHPAYPPYKPEPSEATFGSGIAIPFDVSSLADAQALVAAFGLADDAIFDEMAAFPAGAVSYPANDPRRAYGIKYANGQVGHVSELMAARNANGVGSPGEWKQDAAGNWFWNSELASDAPTTDVMPSPIVPLAANEHIVVGPFGAEIVVDDPTPAQSNGGSIDLSTDPTAQKILEGVIAIRGLLHV